MTQDQFISETIVLLQNNDMTVNSEFEPEDNYRCSIEWPDKEWGYDFSATSWVSLFTAIKAAQLNGDFDDPKEKFPESF